MIVTKKLRSVGKKVKKIRGIKRRYVYIALAVVLSGVLIAYGFNKVENATMTMASAGKADTPIIVLDAGHGGMDGGCSSAAGVPEKGINLNILLTLRDMLEAEGFEVDVTRDTDCSIHDEGIEGIANQKSSDMDNRLAKFNKYPNAICISVHQNQFTDPKYSGAQMFYSAANSKSGELAQCIQNQFVEYLQPDNQRETKLCGKELFLCYYSKNPTVMCECGFLSNPDEAAKLSTEDYQRQVAFTIFAGLNQYLSKTKK
ncbi:MAG: N-acetylmuramoyl-L-alanine amidase [Oscillospiraceae bacterium]|nr:N-acetylmuramoyl-L-alanine amidase [Oscillospiraceae bacterium]